MGRLPIGVAILAALAAAALVTAIFHFLQAIGLVPYIVGPIAVRDFNLWYVLMWGLLIWVWYWVFRALLRLDPSAWMFVVIVSGFNLLFDFLAMLGQAQANDLAVSFIVNLVIFAYAMLPGTKRAFGLEPPVD
ncbi:MAG TPA: hypothetical protein VFO05_07780 [Candidatus Limnocylindrales bacterium]|nr:hypothetical protein [Candidatus Limnocylindrales bacterium]